MGYSVKGGSINPPFLFATEPKSMRLLFKNMI